MSAAPLIATLSQRDLFARLAAGGATRVSVVTPNRRLAQALMQAFDALQMAAGRSVWDAPDILPFAAFVERAYEDALFSELGADLPTVLTPAQEQALWEDIIEDSEEGALLLALPQAAATARDAWQTAHAWRLTGKQRHAASNEDAQAFAGWAQRYERATGQQSHTEAARLPDVVAGLLGNASVNKPGLLVRYGFDILTPQQDALFEVLGSLGCELAACGQPDQHGQVLRLACIDATDEIVRAARWARARLEMRGGARNEGMRGGARIGIVVPDLARQRNLLRRIFTQTMEPAARLAGAPAAQMPFNISLGEALSTRPLVDSAFLVLELAGREIAFERASRLIRSPFIAAGAAEMTHRARLDAELRRRAEPVLSLDRLIALVGLFDAQSPMRAHVLAHKLARLSEFRRARLFGAQSPAQWTRAFFETLSLFGFPGERVLDSVEYQTLQKWHAVLAQFARLEKVVARMGYAEAVARLRRMAADTPFQPESPDVPIQILGVLESASCDFDYLWVMGMTAEAWPLAARPNPFLPLGLQREAGIPEASAEASLELDRRISEGWRGAAAEVVFSHPGREADRELAPSPLIAEIPAGALVLPDYPLYRDLIFASARREHLQDAAAPPAASNTPRGGTALLKDQAACAFRACARHRLGAEALDAPHTGLDAMERGSLVHHVLASVWSELETKHALDSLSEAGLEALLDKSAAEAVARQKRDRPSVLAGRFAEIEQRRLARLARDWLALERGRGEFSVFATEDKRAISIGGLQLNGRLDRVDETAGGERIVIDYKTSAPGAKAWFGERPDEPQLPLYLLATEPQAKAIAFAQVRAGDMKLVALAAEKGILPGARTLPDARLKRAAETWDAQLSAWRGELERLARGFAAGEARVDPLPGACEYCDLKPLCRIHARETQSENDDEAA